jgi:hypothetical protein
MNDAEYVQSKILLKVILLIGKVNVFHLIIIESVINQVVKFEKGAN